VRPRHARTILAAIGSKDIGVSCCPAVWPRESSVPVNGDRCVLPILRQKSVTRIQAPQRNLASPHRTDPRRRGRSCREFLSGLAGPQNYRLLLTYPRCMHRP